MRPEPEALAPGAADRRGVFAGWLVAAAVLATTCTHSAYTRGRIVPVDDHWTLPLLDPLVQRSPVVYGELVDGEVRVPVSAVIDTGAWSTTAGRAPIEALGLRVRRDGQLGSVDVTGARQSWHGVIVPHLVIGDLVVEEIGINVEQSWEHAKMLIGMDLLREAPLEIDTDRGVALFGGPPLAGADGPALVVPLAGSVRSPKVDTILDGHRTLLMLDTGASTLIDWRRAVRMGLPVVHLEEERRHRGVRSEFVVRAQYAPVTVGLGPVVFDDATILPLPEWRRGGLLNRPEVGLFGSDLLRRHRYRIDAKARTLELAPRPDTRATTAERIGRWSWAPRCDDLPGCITHALEPCGDDCTAIAVGTREAYARPAALLFAAVDRDGRLLTQIPAVEAIVPALWPKDVARLPLPSWLAWELSVWGDDVAGLELVDVNPLLDPESARPMTPDEPAIRLRWLLDGLVHGRGGSGTEEADAWRREVAGRYIERRLGLLRWCHRQATERTGGPVAGALTVQWTVGPTGRVEGARVVDTDLPDPELADCVVGGVRHWTFPYPPEATRVPMRHRWRFAAGDG